MQQTNAAAATALYDAAGPANDAGDAVMARWLQSAGLQHLGSPVASTGNNDQRHLPNLLMQVILILSLCNVSITCMPLVLLL